MKPLVYLIEDDQFLVEALARQLEDLGCKVAILRNATALISKRGKPPDYVITDLHIPWGKVGQGRKPAQGTPHGLEGLQRVRPKWPNSRLILITGMPSQDARKWCDANGTTYLLKPVAREVLERCLGLRKVRAFVVHGRNKPNRQKAISALKKARIEPVVLLQQPNLGRTVIEKFEAVADTCDTAVVVWSPDDFGGLKSAGSKKVSRGRARQNVVFELGYFYGALRRRNGCVVVLEFGDAELPSDIAGIVRIDGNMPIENITQELKNEFRHLLE